MKMIRLPAAVLSLSLALALCWSSGARANNINVCAPDASGASTGPRTVGGTLSPVPSGTIYILNGQGCTRVTLQDYGYFLSLGYTQASSQNSIVFNTGVVASGTGDYVVGTLPPKTYIQQIIFSNSIAAAVTGGISIGTTANGTQIVTAQAVGASTDVAVAQANISLPLPATTGLGGVLHMAAVTGWNGANVTVTVIYGYY